MNLRTFVLTEMTQFQRINYVWLWLDEIPRIVNSEPENRMVFGEREWGVIV
jgi:hypothetical protein